MENASKGAADVALRLETVPESRFLCLAGPGNNGGDAMAAARHISIARRPVVVLLLTSRSGELPGGDAGIQLRILRSMGIETHVLAPESASEKVSFEARRADLILDGLFGTGLDRPLTGAAEEVVTAVNASGRRVLALDTPSGLDCDTGRPLGACVRAHHTVTFVAPKLGFSAPGADTWTGDVSVVGIGAPLDWPPSASV